MKIIDISQEVFTCCVYPGDDTPQKIQQKRMEQGDLYNLTSFSMNAHNGTHMDAPFHFIKEGADISQIPLEKTIGFCYVASVSGPLSAARAEEIGKAALQAGAAKKLLLKGDGVVTKEAAEVFARQGIELLGVESQSVGEISAPMAVHKILLGAEIVLLEGIRLNKAEEGRYFLSAAPLALGGSDGAPCRAVLIKE